VTSSSVARRYARALMALGTEDGRFEAYAAELTRLNAAFAASAELQDLWLNPANGRDERLKAIELLTGALQISPVIQNLLKLLVERGRVADLGVLSRAFQEMCDEKAGRVRALVTSAKPLGAEQAGRLQAALAAMTSRQITLETAVDPALIGGVVTQVGSTVLDGSLRTQLLTLQKTLREAR
jgi:F-type H+-transporting ATPase subunit delta